MVWYVLTRPGYDELVASLGKVPSPLWVNENVLSEKKLKQLRENGVEVTNFKHLVNPNDRKAIEDSLATIQEHHPGQSIWVEHAPDL